MECLKKGITHKICRCKTCKAVYKVDIKDTGRTEVYFGERFWICPDCYTRNNWEDNYTIIKEEA